MNQTEIEGFFEILEPADFGQGGVERKRCLLFGDRFRGIGRRVRALRRLIPQQFYQLGDQGLQPFLLARSVFQELIREVERVDQLGDQSEFLFVELFLEVVRGRISVALFGVARVGYDDVLDSE